MISRRQMKEQRRRMLAWGAGADDVRNAQNLQFYQDYSFRFAAKTLEQPNRITLTSVTLEVRTHPRHLHTPPHLRRQAARHRMQAARKALEHTFSITCPCGMGAVNCQGAYLMRPYAVSCSACKAPATDWSREVSS